MARLPLYEQQTSIGATRASAQDFGAGVAQATGEAGGVLLDIGTQIISREATFDALTKARDLEKWGMESKQALEDTEDFSRSDTVEKYNQGLREKQQELLSAHKGTAKSRASLKMQLENQVAQFEKGARETQVKAQYALTTDLLQQKTNQIASQVSYMPEMLDQGFEELDAQITELSDLIPQDQTDAFRNSARASLLTSSINGMMANGAIDKAEAVAKDPKYSRYLAPDVSRKFALTIGAEKGRLAVEARKQEANLMTVSSVIGVPVEQMTPQQRNMAANFDSATMNLVQKISLVEMMQGAPVTKDQRSKLLGLEDRSRQTQTQDLLALLPAFQSGRMTPDENATFLINAEKVFPTQFRLDETSGTYVPVPGSGGIERLNKVLGTSMPRQVAPTGVPIGGVPSGSMGSPVVLTQNGQAFAQGFRGADGMFTAQAIPGAQQPGGDTASAEGVDPEFASEADAAIADGGLFGMADKLAGPVAGVQRAIGGGPVSVGIGQEQVAAARRAELLQRRLVSALQQNPRYAEGEREDIAKSITIEAATMSNPDAYRTRTVEIGRYLDTEIKYNSSVLSKPPGETTVEMRKQAVQAISLMTKMREALALPPKLSPQEAQKLPKGSLFITDQWQLREVR